MTAEEISGGREPRRWVRPVVAVLLVVLIAVIAGDQLLRRHERQALQRCVTAAESDLDDLTYRTAGLEVYIASAVDRPDIPSSVRRSLRGIVQETLLRGVPPLQRDQRRCSSTRTWHQAATAGRRAYLAYLDLRVQQVLRAVENLDALHVVVPEIAPARDRARSELAKAGVTLSP